MVANSHITVSRISGAVHKRFRDDTRVRMLMDSGSIDLRLVFKAGSHRAFIEFAQEQFRKED